MPLFLPYLKNNGHLDNIHMTIASIGSRKIGQRDDFGSKGWHFLSNNLTIYGFDADADACNVANTQLSVKSPTWTEQHIPLALADKQGVRDLYVTKHPMCSSLFPPNEKLLDRYLGLSDVASLDFTVEFETTTLDQFCQDENVEGIDFLQIDVQGAEILVFDGAKNCFDKSVLAIQTEVAFSEIYTGQPLFTDVDKYLRNKGFSLFDYEISSSRRVRTQSPIYSTQRRGQLLWGEAYYIRDLLDDTVSDHLKTPENILKLACTADILEFPDYSLELLKYLTTEYGSNPHFNCADTIVSCLSDIPDLAQEGLEKLPTIKVLMNYTTESCKEKYNLG